MIAQLANREKDFKVQLQKSEREIMSSFAFKKEWAFSKGAAHSSLSETMALKGDHIVVSYMTEFEGKDLNTLSRKMRHTRPEFSTDQEFMRDVQVVIDENYVNYHLFTAFYADKPFSLTE